MLLNLAKGVGEAVRKEDFVIFVFEVVTKVEFEVPFNAILTFRCIVKSAWLVVYKVAAFLPF